MTLDMAINVLADYRMESAFEATPDFKEALQLGIEALKAWKEFRGSGSLMDKMLLPGETEE